jgi:hypothetical protein
MLSVVLLSVLMLSVIMLSALMLSYAECLLVGYTYAECCDA